MAGQGGAKIMQDKMATAAPPNFGAPSATHVAPATATMMAMQQQHGPPHYQYMPAAPETYYVPQQPQQPPQRIPGGMAPQLGYPVQQHQAVQMQPYVVNHGPAVPMYQHPQAPLVQSAVPSHVRFGFVPRVCALSWPPPAHSASPSRAGKKHEARSRAKRARGPPRAVPWLELLTGLVCGPRLLNGF